MMSRKELAMVFVIAKASALFVAAENPFPADLSESARRIALTVDDPYPTATEQSECLAYIAAERRAMIVSPVAVSS